MTIAAGPREMTDAEKEAWTLHLQKVPTPTIQVRTGLLPSQIAAAVDLGQVHARRAMQTSTAVLPEAPAPKPSAAAAAPAAAPVKPASKPAGDEGYLTTNKLLAWAQTSGVTRAVTLAARISEYLAELRRLQEQTSARARAQAEIERLTAELEAAKQALRQAGGTAAAKTSSKPDAARREYLAAIRAWAPGAGHDVPPRGKIPQHIQDAFDAEHPEARP